MHFLGECSELISFWAKLPNLGPLVANKLKMGQNCGFRPLSAKVFTQSNSHQCCTIVEWLLRMFRFWVTLAKFWPSSGQKWLKVSQNDGFSTIIWKCIHIIQSKLGVYTHWATVQNWFIFLVMLAKFWPSSGQTITENGGFPPLSQNVVMQSNLNLVCTPIGWVFRIVSLVGLVGQILAL